MTGTAGDDGIVSYAGDDIVSALEGNDNVYAGLGNDTVHGGEGNDSLDGQEGDDRINGDAGDDRLFGGLGNDIVSGGAGNDFLGVRIDYHRGSDLMSGDQFFGGDGLDTLFFGGDYVYGFRSFDITTLAIGTDIERIEAEKPVTLTFGQLSQFAAITGIFYVTGSGVLDLTANRFLGGTINLGAAADTVTLAGNASGGWLNGGGGNDTLIGSERADSLTGGIGDDRLEGRGGDDYLEGGDGNDTVLGGEGNDSIHDGHGNDLMDGGLGDDTFFANLYGGFSPDDSIVGGGGFDTLYLEADPYHETFFDFSVLNITGIERLVAPSVNLRLSAEQISQFDWLELGALQITTAGAFTASDALLVSAILLSEHGNSVDLSPGTAWNYRVTGGAGADTIIGSNSIDVLTGGGGNDVLRGGASGDELRGGAGSDWLDGGDGDDQLIIAEALSVGDRFTGGSGTDTLYLQHDRYSDVAVIDLTGAVIDADIEQLQGSGVRLTAQQLSGFTSISVQELHLANGGTIDFTGKVTGGQLYLSDSASNVTLSATGFYRVAGGAGNDTIKGNASNNEIIGNGGTDTLIGGGGDDFLVGGTGDDILNGEAATISTMSTQARTWLSKPLQAELTQS